VNQVKAATSYLAALLAAAVSVPMHVAGASYRRRGRRSSGWLRSLSHVQMDKATKHPGQRKTKKMRRANVAMAAFPKAVR